MIVLFCIIVINLVLSVTAFMLIEPYFRKSLNNRWLSVVAGSAAYFMVNFFIRFLVKQNPSIHDAAIKGLIWSRNTINLTTVGISLMYFIALLITVLLTLNS